MTIETQIVKQLMITPGVRKLLISALIILAGAMGARATTPSKNQPGPQILRGGAEAQASTTDPVVLKGAGESLDATIARTITNAPVVIREPEPATEYTPQHTPPTSTIEERLSRVEGAIEAEQREVKSVIRIIGFAVASICVLGLGLLVIRHKS
jgi:hypothetical protein